MTDRLQEIRARLDAATPGPWYADNNTHPDEYLADIAWLLDEVADLAQVNASLLAQIKRLKGSDG